MALNDSEADVREFLGQSGADLPVLLDGSGEIASRYAIQGVPTAYFIDSEGRIANVKIGGSTLEDLTELARSAG